MKLVANRDCGECTVCCEVLPIDEPELQKLPGVICPNCKTGGGCQIYDTRPEVCRGYFCGWRALPELGDDLRPDRSGVLLRFVREHIPPGLNPVGYYFLLFGTNIVGPGFAGYLTQLIGRRIAVFLSIRGPVGYTDGGLLLNDCLAPAIAAGDNAKILGLLREALDALSQNKFEPIVFKYGTPDPPA